MRKKIKSYISSLIILALALCMPLTAYAGEIAHGIGLRSVSEMMKTGSKVLLENGKFVPSIGSKGAPEIEKAVDNDGDDITDLLLITPWGDPSGELNPDETRNFEEGYDAVDLEAAADDINGLIPSGIIQVPESWGTDDVEFEPDELVVTDIFYVHEKYDTGTIDLGVDITVKTNIPDNRIAIIFYYDGNGWTPVPTKRNPDGTLTFRVEIFGPYMIVSNTVVEVPGNGQDIPSSPQTGVDNDNRTVNQLSKEFGTDNVFSVINPVSARIIERKNIKSLGVAGFIIAAVIFIGVLAFYRWKIKHEKK